MGVEPGDKVLYPRDAGYEVRLGGIEVKVLKREDLIARDPRLNRARAALVAGPPTLARSP